MSFPSRITGAKTHESERRNSAIGGTGKVPNAKKPRSRPPSSLRDKLGFLQGHLPKYSGPYSVGCMEIEVPAEAPRTFSHIKRDGKHLLRLETVLFTLYYPADFGSGRGKDPAGRRTWSRETWLPRPRVELAKGYGKFAGVPDSISIPLFAATTMFSKLPCYRNAPPATHWPPEGNSKRGGYRIKNQEGPPPEGGSKQPRFPLLFFSHGLGGTRTAYSSMCGEFASYGFVVCALEHRDGSGPRTFINHPRPEDVDIQERKHQKKRANVDQSARMQRKYGGDWEKVDYVFPEDNPYDTSPMNEQGVDSELRSAQIELRLAEMEEAYRVLRLIHDGKGEEVARQNLRRGGYIGGSSRGLEGVDWSMWADRFHIDKVIAAGHSFGAATITEVLRHTDRFQNVQAGIIYDIWGAPIKPPEEDPRHRIHLPLLGINSEAFMYWKSNFDGVMSLMNEAEEQGAPAFLCTVRGSVHISQSDFSILYPHVCSFFLKATVHPQRAIDLNISASLEFLRDVLPEGAGKAIIERCLTDERLLKNDLIGQLPDEHKPDDKWVAARLKVPHEFRTRMAARAQRKMKRKKKHGFFNPGDEVWMHHKPEAEEIVKWRRRVNGKGDSDSVEEDVRGAGYEHTANDEDEENDEKPDSGDSTDAEPQKTWLGQHPSLCSTDDR